MSLGFWVEVILLGFLALLLPSKVVLLKVSPLSNRVAAMIIVLYKTAGEGLRS